MRANARSSNWQDAGFWFRRCWFDASAGIPKRKTPARLPGRGSIHRGMPGGVPHPTRKSARGVALVTTPGDQPGRPGLPQVFNASGRGVTPDSGLWLLLFTVDRPHPFGLHL